MKILYFAASGIDHSVNAVYIKGFRQNGVDILTFEAAAGGLKKFISAARFYFKNRSGANFVMVGDDSPELVIWLALISRKKIIYNALCSVYERLVISRGLVSPRSMKAWYYKILDTSSCRLCDLVMLESDHQIEFFHNFFGVPKEKCFRAWTGVDEEKFFFDPAVQKFERFTVIFRGRLLPEAGAEYVVRAAKILENTGVDIIMHSFGQELEKVNRLIEELRPTTLRLVTDYLPTEKVRELMLKSHLSLGQLSDHDRLSRTIPHKAYESLAMKLPYLTARNAGVMELLKEGETCLACKPADAEDLARKILWAKEHPVELTRIAESGRKFFCEKLTCQKLAADLLKRLNTRTKLKR